MVYDMSTDKAVYPNTGEPGYAIHKTTGNVVDADGYELYTDDGKGNGDYICFSPDKFWIERIAFAMDNVGMTENEWHAIGRS